MPDVNQSLIFRWTSGTRRLVAALLAGSAAYAAAFDLELELRALLAYDLAVASYLAILFARISAAGSEETRELAEKKETTNPLILTLAGLFSAFSLVGVGLLLHRSQDWTPLMEHVHLALSLLAVFLSWTFLHVVFGIHYARLYYDETPGEERTWRGGFDFPDPTPPDFWDFMYFSFTIAICYQTSDVTIRSRHLRRLTLAHALLSFLNVTVILGLVVEIVSVLVSVPRSR